jgi:hypothetical protein
MPVAHSSITSPKLQISLIEPCFFPSILSGCQEHTKKCFRPSELIKYNLFHSKLENTFVS